MAPVYGWDLASTVRKHSLQRIISSTLSDLTVPHKTLTVSPRLSAQYLNSEPQWKYSLPLQSQLTFINNKTRKQIGKLMTKSGDKKLTICR